MNELYEKLSETDRTEYNRLMAEYQVYFDEADGRVSGGGVRGLALMIHANECHEKAQHLLEKSK